MKLEELYDIIKQRQQDMPEGSYTASLFKDGLDRIIQKVGEEAIEVVIAAKNKSKPELLYETSDLLYHLLVLLVASGVNLEEIEAELGKRKQLLNNRSPRCNMVI